MMKLSSNLTFLFGGLVVVTSIVHGQQDGGGETVIDPNPPVSSTYSCAEQEATCGQDTDRYYELVAGYYKYWIPNFPSTEAIANGDLENEDGAYWRIRTVIGGEGFDDDNRAENITLGPTMVVKPGETMAILIRNNVPADAPPEENQLESVELDPEFWLAALNSSNPDGPNYGLQKGKRNTMNALAFHFVSSRLSRFHVRPI